MTRQELGITVEGEAYINAIINRGHIARRLNTPTFRSDLALSRDRSALPDAEAEVVRSRDALRASPEWRARYDTP